MRAAEAQRILTYNLLVKNITPKQLVPIAPARLSNP